MSTSSLFLFFIFLKKKLIRKQLIQNGFRFLLCKWLYIYIEFMLLNSKYIWLCLFLLLLLLLFSLNWFSNWQTGCPPPKKKTDSDRKFKLTNTFGDTNKEETGCSLASKFWSKACNQNDTWQCPWDVFFFSSST